MSSSDQNRKRRNYSGSGAPNFVEKLDTMLESPQYESMVSWSRDGTALVIKNVATFTDYVLPAFFKHRNLSSFIRQLNMYNFSKVRSEEGEQVYANEYFVRDNKSNYRNIKRRVAPEGAEGEGIVALKEGSGRANLTKTQSRELHEIAQKQRDMEMICLRLTKENKNMIAQNSRMWRKLSRRLEKKDRRVEKLLCFLLLGTNQSVLEDGANNEGVLQTARPTNLMMYNEDSEVEDSDSSEQFGSDDDNEEHDSLRSHPKFNLNGTKGLYPMIERKNAGASRLKKLIEMLIEQNSANAIKKKKTNFTIVGQEGTANHQLAEEPSPSRPTQNLCIKENGESVSGSPRRLEQSTNQINEEPVSLDRSIISDVNLFLNEEHHEDEESDWFKLNDNQCT